MFFKKNEQSPEPQPSPKGEGSSPDAFWREYEEKTGEKVLSRGLGKCIFGWEEFDGKKRDGIWGLLITTSGGFRFQHFPQKSWLDAFTHFSETEPPKDNAIFIPKEKIVSSQILKETKWWKKIFCPSVPQLVIHCTDEAGRERRMVFEIITKAFLNARFP